MANEKTEAAKTEPAPPQVIVQMMTPTATDATEGLSQTVPMGSYDVWETEVGKDGVGKQVKKTVNAEGQSLK